MSKSKYFDKHYYIAELTDVRCGNEKCKKVFAVDYDACKIEANTLGDEWFVFYCPYCLTKLRVHV